MKDEDLGHLTGEAGVDCLGRNSLEGVADSKAHTKSVQRWGEQSWRISYSFLGQVITDSEFVSSFISEQNKSIILQERSEWREKGGSKEKKKKRKRMIRKKRRWTKGGKRSERRSEYSLYDHESHTFCGYPENQSIARVPLKIILS